MTDIQTPPKKDPKPKQELLVLKTTISVDQRFATGPIMGKFLKNLKDKKILAIKCPKCGRLQSPPPRDMRHLSSAERRLGRDRAGWRAQDARVRILCEPGSTHRRDARDALWCNRRSPYRMQGRRGLLAYAQPGTPRSGQDGIPSWRQDCEWYATSTCMGLESDWINRGYSVLRNR